MAMRPYKKKKAVDKSVCAQTLSSGNLMDRSTPLAERVF